ncbi:MAG: hypothetical protein JXA10_05585, partial [Anaerolineae bacterium]|nr:hypothetical protein [Anaerolineae bacterium]
IYGAWQSHERGNLYLAPDRILYNWRSFMAYTQIIELAAIAIYRLPRMLRITYTLPDDPQPQVIGFSMQYAEAWGQTLAIRSGMPLAIIEGRKKKT